MRVGEYLWGKVGIKLLGKTSGMFDRYVTDIHSKANTKLTDLTRIKKIFLLKNDAFCCQPY